eukprot:1844509-Ditylum_brightwellii.AAC.1
MLDTVSYRRVVVKEEIDTALFKQHVKHFSQVETEKNPFTTNLLKQLGSYAETTLGTLFRTPEKELPDLDLDTYTKELPKHSKEKRQTHPRLTLPSLLLMSKTTIKYGRSRQAHHRMGGTSRCTKRGSRY